ncbi:serine protease, partial [bacterium]
MALLAAAPFASTVLGIGSGSVAQAQTAPVPIAPAAPTSAVPRDASEIKLSFAPLVKTSAPAVVNVYAARKLVARSPFA